MSWTHRTHAGGYHKADQYSTEPPVYQHDSSRAGPSHQPYRHADHHQRSYSAQDFRAGPIQSWDELQSRHAYHYSPSSGGYQADLNASWRNGAAESIRTQPGHDHFYNERATRDIWSAAGQHHRNEAQHQEPFARSNGHHSPSSFSSGRYYSTRAHTQTEEGSGHDRYRPLASPEPFAQNRRVSQLSGQSQSGSYIPPHRRGHSAPEPETGRSQSVHSTGPAATGASFEAGTADLSLNTSSYRSDKSLNSSMSRSTTSHSSKTGPFVVTLPTPEYIALSDASTSNTPAAPPITKLLVLDLNGALIYRNSKGSGEKRRSYPRPYLAAFLEYLFLPEPRSEQVWSGQPRRAWEVFVWSSAQPHNVQAMVEGTFGDVFVEGIWQDEADDRRSEREARGEGRLLGVWARDKLGLQPSDYRQKVQTVKDLRLLSAHLKHVLPADKSNVLRDLNFDESNMVLLDDSPLKGIHQPWNEIVLPEYEREAYQKSISAAILDDEEPVPPDMDNALLCVIGILEIMRHVVNVPAWIRAGGLDGPKVRDDDRQPPTLPQTTLENLPSAASFVHWHAVPSIRQYWLEQGKLALQRKGIKLRHDMDSVMATNGVQGGASAMSTSVKSKAFDQVNGTAKERTPHPLAGIPSSGSTGREMAYRNDDRSAGASPTKTVSRQGRKKGYSPSRPISLSPSLSPEPAEQRQPVDSGPAMKSDNNTSIGSPPPLQVDPAVPSRPVRSRKLRMKPIETWRTFKACDVSSFLFDMSERVTVPLTAEQRQSLATAASILAQLAREVEVPSRRTKASERVLRSTSRNELFGNGGGGGIQRPGSPCAPPEDLSTSSNAVPMSSNAFPTLLRPLDFGIQLARQDVGRMPKGMGDAAEVPIQAPPAGCVFGGSGKKSHPAGVTVDQEDGPPVKTHLGLLEWLQQKKARNEEAARQALAAQTSKADPDTVHVENGTTCYLDVPSEAIGPSRSAAPDKAAPEALLSHIFGHPSQMPPLLHQYAALRLDLDDLVERAQVDPNGSGSLANIEAVEAAIIQLREWRIELADPHLRTSEIKHFLRHIEEVYPGEDLLDEYRSRLQVATGAMEDGVIIPTVSSTPAMPAESAAKSGVVAPPGPNLAVQRGGQLFNTPESDIYAMQQAVQTAITAVNKLGAGAEISAEHARQLFMCAKRQLCAGIGSRILTAEEALLVHRPIWQVDNPPDRVAGMPPQSALAGMSELDKWRQTAFLDIRIPRGSKGELSLMVTRQIIQDLLNNEPASSPYHVGTAALSRRYPSFIKRIRYDKHGGPQANDVVQLAILEAARLIRRRAEAQNMATRGMVVPDDPSGKADSRYDIVAGALGDVDPRPSPFASTIVPLINAPVYGQRNGPESLSGEAADPLMVSIVDPDARSPSGHFTFFELGTPHNDQRGATPAKITESPTLMSTKASAPGDPTAEPGLESDFIPFDRGTPHAEHLASVFGFDGERDDRDSDSEAVEPSDGCAPDESAPDHDHAVNGPVAEDQNSRQGHSLLHLEQSPSQHGQRARRASSEFSFNVTEPPTIDQGKRKSIPDHPVRQLDFHQAHLSPSALGASPLQSLRDELRNDLALAAHASSITASTPILAVVGRDEGPLPHATQPTKMQSQGSKRRRSATSVSGSHKEPQSSRELQRDAYGHTAASNGKQPGATPKKQRIVLQELIMPALELPQRCRPPSESGELEE